MTHRAILLAAALASASSSVSCSECDGPCTPRLSATLDSRLPLQGEVRVDIDVDGSTGTITCEAGVLCNSGNPQLSCRNGDTAVITATVAERPDDGFTIELGVQCDNTECRGPSAISFGVSTGTTFFAPVEYGPIEYDRIEDACGDFDRRVLKETELVEQ